ncbi:MAG: hypothetical protein QNJ46_09605 [Leptolyngbyaceae cyanobacterium MO_188.B28]|nr:hypothetical protein [Leptolyngbyaceae cyanobacterium MO_188.B28]
MTPEQYLWEMALQNFEHCRHHENQRQAVTNFTIAIAGALLTVIGIDQTISRLDLLPALLVVLVGFHGMVTAWKHEERFHFYYSRFRVLRDKLDDKIGISVASLNKIADAAHRSRFPRFNKIGPHRLWFLLHVLITLTGLCLFIVVLIIGK